MAKNNGQLTVLDMYKSLQKAVRAGYGSRLLVVGNDNEGNYFHGCFFGCDKLSPEMADLIEDSVTNDTDNLMVIG